MIISSATKSVIVSALKFLTGCLYLVTLLSAYGGYFNPHYWTLPSIGVLFFPYFATFTLIAAICWLIARKLITGCVGIGILLACGPTFSQAVPFRFSNSPSNPEKTFKMVTFNCFHLTDMRRENSEHNRSLDFLIHSDADFICLQECYSLDHYPYLESYQKQLDSLKSIYPYISADKSEKEFLSKYPFTEEIINIGEPKSYSNIAVYKLKVDGNPLTVINVHLSSYKITDSKGQLITDFKSQSGVKNRLKELKGSFYDKMRPAFRDRAEVSKAIAEYAESVEGNVIVCGDFNDVPGSWAYRNFTKRGFEDAYAQTGFGHIITFNEHLMWFHIDQILYKGDLVPLYVKKGKLDASDHYPLLASFEFL